MKNETKLIAVAIIAQTQSGWHTGPSFKHAKAEIMCNIQHKNSDQPEVFFLVYFI
jgi:hypothetical protein